MNNPFMNYHLIKYNTMKNTLVKYITASLIGLLLSFNAMANTAQEKGLAIAKEIEFRDRGWKDVKSELEMVLTNKKGRSSKRSLTIKTLEVQGDGDKSLSIFKQPKDVKGTAFLSFSHSLVPDQQWLYLPALKRVKRISSSNKSGPFLGSEFAFEDLSSFEVEKYQYEFIREDKMNGEDYFIVKFFPQYKHSGYTFQEVWVNKNEYRIDKIIYYDRKATKLKTLSMLNFNQYLDKYWRADMFKVENHQTGKKTTLTWKNYQFQSGLDTKDFDKNALKRAN